MENHLLCRYPTKKGGGLAYAIRKEGGEKGRKEGKKEGGRKEGRKGGKEGRMAQ